MFYLLLAIISSAMVSIFMRLNEKYVRNNMVMFTANYAVCLVLSLLYMGNFHIIVFEKGIGKAIVLGSISGILYLVNFVILQKNVRHNGVILSSAAMKLGAVLIPVMIAIIIFHERLGWLQLIGVMIAIAAVILMNVEKGSIEKGGKKLWLLVLLLGSGITDTMTNIYDKTGAPSLKNHFLFYIFLAALLSAVVMVFVKKQKVTPADILCGVLLGIPNYYSARFLLLALGSVPAVITYPVNSVGAIIVISVVGMLIFREKLSKQKKYTLLMILLALVLLNI